MAAPLTGNQLAIKILKPLLAKLGFKKRTGGIFTIELSPEIIGRVGLNSASRHLEPGEVEINPVVGVRHQQVERLVAELRGEKFHPYIPSTTGTPIGYLFPEPRYRAWIFSPNTADETARDMVDAVATYGLPYMRSVTSSMEDLCRELESGKRGHDYLLIYRRPVARLLCGDVERAKTLLDKALAAQGNRTDGAAEEFKRFADAFRRYISNGTDKLQL